MTKIPVVFCFDKRIILGASVAISSLIDCASDETIYDIRIFHSDLNEKHQTNLKKLTKSTRHEMKFHYINPDIFKNAPHNNGSWRTNVYYRLLTPSILTEYDKAVYADSDMLFKEDLTELYNTDIEGYQIGAVPTATQEYIKKYDSIRFFPENKNDKDYISAFI